MPDPETTYVKCPECGTVSLLDDCDVFGADDGNVICTHRGRLKDGRQWECGHEFGVEENVYQFDDSFDAAESLPDQKTLFE